MKMNLLLTSLLFSLILGIGCSKDNEDGSNPDNPSKPSPLPDLPDPDDVCSCMEDLTFMQYCYDKFDVNKDGKVSKIEAAAVVEIDLERRDVRKLTGIGYFSNLESLNCSSCSQLNSVDLRNNLKVTSFTFSGCYDLLDVKLPSTISVIGRYAFAQCPLTSIHIPSKVEMIESGAFYRTKLKNVTFEKGSQLTIIKGNQKHAYAQGAFGCCDSLISIEIPASVEIIEDRVFEYCTNLETITFQKNSLLKTLGANGPEFEGVFNNCLKLNNVSIPTGVELIGNSTFYKCQNLKNITLPEKITSILDYTFSDCTNLENIVIPECVTSIGDWAFSGCSSLTSIVIPESVTSIGASAFYRCISLTSIYCKSTTPPRLSEGYGLGVSGFVLYVPAQSIDAYKESDWRSYYSSIEAIK